VLGFATFVVFGAMINLFAAILVMETAKSGDRLEAERTGRIAVSSHFLKEATQAEAEVQASPGTMDREHFALNYAGEAKRIAEESGGDKTAIELKLRISFEEHGTEDFVSVPDSSALSALATSGRLPQMLGSWILLWWFVMLVCQGEGLELDVQRRREPMWEWLFSHPAPPGAIFLSEMLSPIAANPMYWAAPLFAGVLYASVYGSVGLWAVLLAGVPLTIAAACMGKALEMGITLRFSSRTRGAMLGIVTWLGFASMMLMFAGRFLVTAVITAIPKFLEIFTAMPWPWLKLFLGARPDGSFSFWLGIAACSMAAAVVVSLSVWFTVWSAQHGLSGNFAAETPSRKRMPGVRFGKDPLYRKEFLWFLRDRSAVVQVILIPLTILGIQLFNLRTVLEAGKGQWTYLSGAAIILGTYFLWILGPKSLASEGNALWIALTWPRGLESLLKSKAWLWSAVSSAIVLLILGYTAFSFPHQLWKIALVGVGWLFFGPSMSQKSVTLVSVASSSGELERVPWTRRGAAQLGMLTFATGVITQQWTVAIAGVVYSYMTAAAMWENLRARLPYLYDPWSEELPPPPTLLHAMVPISLLVEGGAIATIPVVIFAGRENLAMARAISYAACAVMVCLGTVNFLEGRGVSLKDVCYWPSSQISTKNSGWPSNGNSASRSLLLLLVGAGGGLLLGLLAHVYSGLLSHLPSTSELIRQSREQLENGPHFKLAYFIMAVIFAPFAEEYLFRGLLFRALDREWGGWYAILGSAAFFAVYHPPLAWIPVGLLGVTNAILFKRTGQLAPAVVLHMVYNAVVLA
jgi:membrane protease YdiL (CAAX protease family)